MSNLKLGDELKKDSRKYLSILTSGKRPLFLAQLFLTLFLLAQCVGHFVQKRQLWGYYNFLMFASSGIITYVTHSKDEEDSSDAGTGVESNEQERIEEPKVTLPVENNFSNEIDEEALISEEEEELLEQPVIQARVVTTDEAPIEDEELTPKADILEKHTEVA